MRKLLVAMTCTAVVLFGDYTMVMQNHDDGHTSDQTIRYRDDNLMNFRMNEGGEGRNDFYVIGEKAYSLSESDGKIVYFDIDEMQALFSAMGNMAEEMGEESFQKKREEMDLKVIKKKGTTSVAGIKGELWTIEYMEEDEKHTEEIVVTKDKGVKTVYRAWGVLFSRIFKPKEPLNLEEAFEVEPGYVVIKAEEMEVTAFSDDRLNDSEFALPKGAKQQSMKGFSGLFGGGDHADDSADETEASYEEEPHADGEGDSEADRKPSDAAHHDSGGDDDVAEEAVKLLKSLF